MNFSNSIGDCSGAVEVYDYESSSNLQFPGNAGLNDDFFKVFPEQKEINSVWLRLEPRLNGEFTMDIIAPELNGKISFFLFKANDNIFCEDFSTNYLKPIKYIIAHDAISNDVATGPEDFKPTIETNTQDVYYLLVHTRERSKSPLIIRYERNGELEETQAHIQDYRSDEKGKGVHIKIRDSETGQPIEANLAIDGMEENNALYLGTDFIFDPINSREIFIQSNTQGYFIFAKTYNTQGIKNRDAELLIELVKLAPGKKLQLDNIKFEIASDAFLPIALPALKRLLDFMALNQEIKIEIQGHVNSPDAKNTWATRRLSKKRARAVYGFLKSNGISKDRMQIVGFGNTQMIFENPKNNDQEEANRRVEILILDT